ncbi:MAG: polyribonucleotide nucleotidyltransferase [Oscillospiraceae bacterium]|nr:polyribonucleotide nucleotidyltransferase [Oscillospiraceae bacterium]MCD8099862.1 polyribonucleotide nucleotidyltransferase [Oscillospiraceae bacterium]MCD8192366.1 polyribonucleotide nucleotidyltransferase [Oscillospiraceae bacterium]
MDYEGRPLKMEIGKMAELCNAAVLTSYGETTVLVTVVASARPKDGIDYFPLSVDFNEKLYSVGRIPGSFMRREAKPSLNAVLAARLIDRPMRPLFPSDLRNDVIITCDVLSVDRDCSPEITAAIGAAAAVCISDVPFNGPIASILLGWDGEKYLFNPTKAERENNRMTVTISASHKKIIMIEAEADQIPEDIMYEGILQAHEHLQPVLDLIDKMVADVGKPKFTYEHAAFDDELFEKLVANEFEGMEHCMDTDDKNVREERVNEWVTMVQEKYGEEHPDLMQYMDEILYKIQKKVVKKWLLAGKRVDGRAMNEIRPLASEVGLIPCVHGSGLFTRGQTQVLSIATLNTLSMCQKIDTIWEEDSKRFMHHYNMPPYSTGEARPARSTSRREYGHGALVEKALQAVIPSVEDFPYAIRVVSEVLSSNGSTSQGSICGSTLALMDAGVPIKAPVAGISCGLIQDGEDWTTFIDIQGVEDFHGEMDFKVAGTKQGITAIQMDLKNDGLKHEIVKKTLEMTREARIQILDEIMLPVISEPRKELAKSAPKMIQMRINPDKIREVIGSGGKVIQKITADTGCKIDINDDGSVFIASEDIDACRAARQTIENIVFEPEVGQLYYGKVVRIIPIGAFVELVPGKDGMCHIKDLEFRRTEKVEDVLNIGDMTWVKVTGIDERGRVNLSRKDAIRERERLGFVD